MNKLMGLLELRDMKLPSIPWKQYSGHEELSNDFLWTIRCAVYRGDDLNLPRSVGKNAEKSKKFADDLLRKINNNGMVIYYPYFIANKSGTLEVKRDCVIVEAVKKDLWNLVTYSDREVTIIFRDKQTTEYMGNKEFLKENEQQQLLKHVPEIRRIFKDDLLEGKSAVLEWSYAVSCNYKKEPCDVKNIARFIFYMREYLSQY